ncbi:MAG: RNA polymerase sigma factor [Acidimicrobiales bacterium]
MGHRYAPAIAPHGSGPRSARGPRPQDELVAAAQAGDRAALDRLLRDHHDRIAALCHRMCGNPADGADATQEALIAIVRGLPRFDGRAAFSTWAYRVATNACLDELRRRSRRPLTGVDDAVLEGAVPVDPHGRGGGVDVAGTVADRLDVDAALAALSPDHRAAVVLRDLCTLDYAEIAEVLGVPPGTVRSRIARGRAALAEVLAGNRAPADGRPNSRP